MSQMADFTHDSSFDPGFWELPLSNKNSLHPFGNGQSVDDKGNNMTNLFNEFVNNEIDFSEPLDYFKPKCEDNFFDCPQASSYDFESFGTKSNRRHNELIRPDLDLDAGIGADSRQFLSSNPMENFGGPAYSSFGRQPEKRFMPTSFDEKVTDQSAFQEIPQQKPLQHPQMPVYGLSSQPEKSNPTTEFQPQYKPANDSQLTTKHLEEISKKPIASLPTMPIKTKSNELRLSLSTQEYQSIFSANINLAHPFIMHRKTSFQDGQSTKAPSQSSLESPEFVKKWAEVSTALHNESFQSLGAEGQSKAKKKGGKKKLKTANDEPELKADNSQQIKQEASTNRLKQEASSNRVKQELSSHHLKQENSSHQMMNVGGMMRMNSDMNTKVEEAMKFEEIMKVGSAKSENVDLRARMSYENANASVNQMMNPGPMNPHLMNRNNFPNQMGNYAKPVRFNPNGPGPNPQAGGYPNAHMNESGSFQQDGYGNHRGLTYERSAGTKEPHENMRMYNPTAGQMYNQQGGPMVPNQYKNGNQEQYSQFAESGPIKAEGSGQMHMPKQYPYSQPGFPQQQQQPISMQQPQMQPGQYYPQQGQKMPQNYPPQQNQQLPPQQQYNGQPMRQQYPPQQIPQQQQQHTMQQYPQQPKQRIPQPYPQDISQSQYPQQPSHQQYPQQIPQQKQMQMQQKPQPDYSQNTQHPYPQQLQQQKSQPDYNQQPTHQPQQFAQPQGHHPQQYPSQPQYQQHPRQLGPQQQQQMLMKQPPQMMQKLPQNQPNPQQQPHQSQQQPSQLPPNQMGHQPQNPQATSQLQYNQKMQMQQHMQQQQPQLHGANPKMQKALSHPNPQMQPMPQPTQTPNQRIPQQMNSMVNPPMLNEAIATFMSKNNNSNDLLNNLPISAEIRKDLKKTPFLEKIRRIGTLSVEERKAKVEKYLEKRKQKSWDKKTNYQSRKKVANNRLRVKGRFVTKDQTDNGAEPGQEGLNDELKQFEDNSNNFGSSNEFMPDFNKAPESSFKDFIEEEDKGFVYPEFDFRPDASFFD